MEKCVGAIKGNITEITKSATNGGKQGVINVIYDTPAFMPDDYIAELPPQDVLAHWAVEAKEMCENYKTLNARLGEQIRSRLEQMVSDSLNRRPPCFS